LVDGDFVRAHFQTADGYREFVAVYLAERRMSRELEGYLGDWEA
jgi:hypothetical protein